MEEQLKKICFIAIDDDRAFNLITKLTISREYPDAEIYTFSKPEEGLQFIRDISVSNHKNYIILLDINMPGLTGWDVLAKIRTFDSEIQNLIKIYMLSSSVDHRDKEKANINILVSGYIEKPLKKLTIQEMMAAA